MRQFDERKAIMVTTALVALEPIPLSPPSEGKVESALSEAK